MPSLPETLPEHWLEAALAAASPQARAKYASHGLSLPEIEPDTQSLLLRQLYLAHMDRERFEDARAVATQVVELGELGDVAFHDLSRAYSGLGDFDACAAQLLMASRCAPASRRAFHLSCLGGLQYCVGKPGVAVSTLARALRWATKRSTLYQCQLELARFATDGAGRPEVVREWLRASKTLGRYGAFLLGEACFQLKLLEEGTHHHTTFLQLVKEADSGLQAGLRAEVLWVQGRLERADGGG